SATAASRSEPSARTLRAAVLWASAAGTTAGWPARAPRAMLRRPARGQQRRADDVAEVEEVDREVGGDRRAEVLGPHGEPSEREPEDERRDRPRQEPLARADVQEGEHQ